MKRLAFAVLATLAACTNAPPIGTAAQAIINGVTDSDDPNIVMVIGLQSSGMASLCTGEVISPHVVLTAAHCVDPRTVGAGATMYVFPGPVLPAAPKGSDFLAVKETHFDTAFNPDPSTVANGHDVGVVIMVSPMTVAPLQYQRTALASSMVGNAVRLVGYGITSGSDTMGTSAGTRRQAPSVMAKLDNLFVGLQDGSHGICEGDSGGPALMKFGDSEHIIGVTSFGFNGCPLTGQQGFEAGNDTRIDTYVSFIDMYVAMFDPPTKSPGDTCGTDMECMSQQCVQESGGKVCAVACDPAAMPSSCASGTTCTDVDGSNVCVANPKKSGGCAVGGPVGGSDGALVAFAALALLGLALRRRATR